MALVVETREPALDAAAMYRRAGQRLADLAIELRAAGARAMSIEAARAAERAFRAERAELRDPAPRWSRP